MTNITIRNINIQNTEIFLNFENIDYLIIKDLNCENINLNYSTNEENFSLFLLKNISHF
jgi:hypothetical protein